MKVGAGDPRSSPSGPVRLHTVEKWDLFSTSVRHKRIRLSLTQPLTSQLFALDIDTAGYMMSQKESADQLSTDAPSPTAIPSYKQHY